MIAVPVPTFPVSEISVSDMEAIVDWNLARPKSHLIGRKKSSSLVSDYSTSEPQRALGGDAECALERDPGAPERALVEEPSDQCHAVRNAARR
jgi:hypothetical protein